MLRRLYDLVLSYADKPSAPVALGIVSFAESSFFPVPPDALLMPMCLARPERSYHYALICSITSVLGGLLGYYIGAVLFDTVGQWVIHTYGLADKVEAYRKAYQDYGQWIILIKGFTPIPFKLVTIASGLAGFNIWWFLGLSIITRSARFFVIALLMHSYGTVLRDFIEKHLTLLAIFFVVALVGGFVAVKYLM